MALYNIVPSVIASNFNVNVKSELSNGALFTGDSDSLDLLKDCLESAGCLTWISPEKTTLETWF